jgi:hypothetical protein
MWTGKGGRMERHREAGNEDREGRQGKTETRRERMQGREAGAGIEGGGKGR